MQEAIKHYIDKGELKQVAYTKEQVIEILYALGIDINEFSGMCNRTDDCGSSADYDKGTNLITSDNYVFQLYYCYDCYHLGAMIERFEEVYKDDVNGIHC